MMCLWSMNEYGCRIDCEGMEISRKKTGEIGRANVDAKMFSLYLYTVGSNQRILDLSMQFRFPCYEDHSASHLNDRLEGQDWRLGTS